MTNRQNDRRVGYKRPPVEHQFRPGTSGNPNGRPKGSVNFKSELRDELSQLVTVSDGGKELTVTKMRGIVKNLVAAALKGDDRAMATVLSLCARAFDKEDDADEAPEDPAILKAMVKASSVRKVPRGETSSSTGQEDRSNDE
jgi:hypothetical protein